MNVLCIGDVVGKNGIEVLRKNIEDIKRENNIDFVIINGENSCAGRGIKEAEYNALKGLGADVITMGNHLYYRKEAKKLYREKSDLIIPANINDEELSGHGYIIKECNGKKIAVVNLIGKVNVFKNTEHIQNPFRYSEELVNELKDKGADYIFIDMHAEATAEKLALGYFLDGKATCIFGTHTHIQTADERILPNGTAYITDVGMCGPKYSVIGLKKEIAISRFYDEIPYKYEYCDEGYQLNGIVVNIDDELSKATNISRLNI